MIVKMSYDWYEANFGDGFYPFFDQNNSTNVYINIRFEPCDKRKAWVQKLNNHIDDPSFINIIKISKTFPITGIDNLTAKKLLEILNVNNDVKYNQICNSKNYYIYKC